MTPDPHPHNFQLPSRNFVTVYRRVVSPEIDVTIGPAPESTELVLTVRRGEQVTHYRPWDVLPNGISASDLVLGWIDPEWRPTLFARFKVKELVEPAALELEMAKRFLGQKPGGAVPPAS